MGNGTSGTLGVGGAGGPTEGAFNLGGGGGGGGLYGGGGGQGGVTQEVGGGGGGSGFGTELETGVREGPGVVTIDWSADSCGTSGPVPPPDPGPDVGPIDARPGFTG